MVYQLLTRTTKMVYGLSESDRAKLSDVIRKVDALTASKKQNEQVNKKGREYTYVKLTENVLDTGDPTLFWYGVEVGFDSAGAAVTKPNGRVWDIDSLGLVVEGGAGEVNDILRAEPGALSDNALVWIALKADAGESKTRLKVKATVTVNSGAVFLCDIIDNLDVVLTVDVNVIQRKFSSAKFYIGEIIYGDIDGLNYIADAYLAGIGVG